MSDFFPSDRPASANLPELSVSELAGSIKRTIETTYDRVRVRGELGRVTIAAIVVYVSFARLCVARGA